MSVTDRWTAKLHARNALLARAERSVRYWARRAGSARGRQTLREAVARRALRRRQVGEAQRVLARHDQVTAVSRTGIAFVAGFEGFRARPYRDAVGVLTIGYGETEGVTATSGPWTRIYALERLKRRIDRDYLRPVLDLADCVGLHLRQNEADALASLVYNLGPGVLNDGKTMGDALRSKDRARIAAAFLVYDKARKPNGEIVALPGLTRRRKAERALFLKG